MEAELPAPRPVRKANASRAGGAFSAPVELAAEATHSAFVTPVGIDDAGDVIVGVYTAGSKSAASYAWRPAGGSFTLLPLSEPFNTNAVAPAVAIDRAGDAIAAWADKTSSGKYLVKAIRRPAGGSFGNPATELKRPPGQPLARWHSRRS